MISQWWFHYNGSGLLAALWTEIWHWGLGVGLIILCGLLAYFSPFDKKYFIGAGVFRKWFAYLGTNFSKERDQPSRSGDAIVAARVAHHLCKSVMMKI